MTSKQDRGPWSQRFTAPCTAERTLGGHLGRLSGKMPLVGFLTGWAILLEVSPMGTVLGGGGWGVCEILVVGKCNLNGVGVVGVSPRQMRYLASVLFSFCDIQLLGHWDVQSCGYSASASFCDIPLLRYSASGVSGYSEWAVFSFWDIQFLWFLASGIFNQVAPRYCSASGIFSFFCDIQLLRYPASAIVRGPRSKK